MGFWLLVFVLTPIVEMYLLIRVGGYFGAWPTIGLVVLTAVVGVALLRIQGLSTLARGMNRLESGELPAEEAVGALLLAVAGVLLVVPGFATDALGFLLLVPPVRAAAVRRVLGRVVVVGPGLGGSRSGANDVRHGRAPLGRDRSQPGDRSYGGVIEGEFESRDDDSDESRRLP